jgi:3-oxoacyl-[acyl-carrier-protein] synthase-3
MYPEKDAPMDSAGLISLAVEVPRSVRTNDYYRTRCPELVERAEQHSAARWFGKESSASSDPFFIEMEPYLADVFRGTVERRVISSGETAHSLELAAAKRALSLARLDANDIDLIISSSFLPDRIGVGNAVFLARDLGAPCAAWNLEATCASSIIGLQTACGLVRAGQHRRVLVVASCTYSRVSDDADDVSWFCGDGAGSFVVGDVAAGQGFLAGAAMATVETADAMYFDWDRDTSRIVMHGAAGAGRVISQTAEPYLRAACSEAAKRANVSFGEIDCLVVNTPSAWYASFAARVLGIDPARTISTYPQYSNIGAALMPANVYAAVSAGKIQPGDLVMLYGFGGVGAAAAAVMRWGNVAVGHSDQRISDDLHRAT